MFEDFIKNAGVNQEEIETALYYIKTFGKLKKPIYVFGNGGSAYTANHFVQDLVKVHGFRAESLSESIGIITAVANDISYDRIFEYQLSRRPAGLVIPISYSGNSKNIIDAVRYCNRNQWPVISITGGDGGELKKLCEENDDKNVNVLSDNIFAAEGVHSLILHYFIDEIGKQK